MTVFADVDGAVRIARIAAQFNWTWMSDDIARFGEAAGWRIEEQSEFDVVLRTNLAVARNESMASLVDIRVDYALAAAGHEVAAVYTYVADLTASERPFTEADVVQQFLLLRSRFEAEFGLPDRAAEGDLMWVRSDVLFGLTRFSTSVHLKFINPVYQKVVDDYADDSERVW